MIVKKILETIVLLVCFIFQGDDSETFVPDPNIIRELQEKTVLIVRPTLKDFVPKCAGVWIDHQNFVTAAHCIEPENVPDLYVTYGAETTQKIRRMVSLLGTPVYYVSSRNDAVRWGSVTVHEPDVDIALVKADPDSPPPNHGIATFSCDRSSPYNTISISHSSSKLWHARLGHVTNDLEQEGPFDKPVRVFTITDNAVKGDSGSVAFDESGCALGVLSYIDSQRPHLSFFIHGDIVVQIIDEFKSDWVL